MDIDTFRKQVISQVRATGNDLSIGSVIETAHNLILSLEEDFRNASQLKLEAELEASRTETFKTVQQQVTQNIIESLESLLTKVEISEIEREDAPGIRRVIEVLKK